MTVFEFMRIWDTLSNNEKLYLESIRPYLSHGGDLSLDPGVKQGTNHLGCLSFWEDTKEIQEALCEKGLLVEKIEFDYHGIERRKLELCEEARWVFSFQGAGVVDIKF